MADVAIDSRWEQTLKKTYFKKKSKFIYF